MIHMRATLTVLATVVALTFQGVAHAGPGGEGLATVVDNGSAVVAGPVGPNQATPLPATHRCHNFGFIPPTNGYVAGECASLELFTNSQGDTAIRALGQSFCQRYPDMTLVQCAGIVQQVMVFDRFGVAWGTAIHRCGARLGHAPCPTGRFQNLSFGAYLYCMDIYTAIIHTTLYLPVTGREEKWEYWSSASFNPGHSYGCKFKPSNSSRA